MDSAQVPKKTAGGSSGIALFMVIAAMTVLSILVTEFTYISQVSQRMAFDGLDQVRALYLAKTGLKLSLLRLKAFQQVKTALGGAAGNAGAATIPKPLLDKIWSFPFFFPIPTQLPGITPAQREQINKFVDTSGLKGKFSAVIESESSKYNLNMILAPFAASASAAPTPGASPSPTPSPSPSPSPAPSFDPQVARESLTSIVDQLLTSKNQSDPNFAKEYSTLRTEDIVDGIIAWSDITYEKRSTSNRELIPPKRAPFYSISELHMVYPIDDQLYEVLAPSFTVSTTPGININTMKAPVLRSLVPKITAEEVNAFFKFRDDETGDNAFKTEDDFFNYLKNKVSAFHEDDEEIKRFKENLAKQQIRLLTDESVFKITVKADVNQASKLLEAWVTLQPPSSKTPPDSGLKITFMRIL